MPSVSIVCLLALASTLPVQYHRFIVCVCDTKYTYCKGDLFHATYTNTTE
jgi:hypothetical protein